MIFFYGECRRESTVSGIQPIITFMQKPFTMQELSDKVRQAIADSRK